MQYPFSHAERPSAPQVVYPRLDKILYGNRPFGVEFKIGQVSVQSIKRKPRRSHP